MPALLLGGCYTRVTNTKGINGSRHTVQESYRSETFLDKAFDSLLNPQPSSGFKSAEGLSRDASITAPAPPKKSATAYDGGGKYPR
jgi:hypothetical protein